MRDKVLDEINALHLKVEKLLAEKYSEEDIIEKLKANGVETHYAKTIIGNIEDDKINKKNFKNLLITGSSITIMGLAINFMSYRIADNLNSSTFLLFWGIVIAGIIMVIRAFILYRN